MRDKNIHIEEIEKKVVFTTPENYFDNLSENIFKSVDPLHQLKEKYSESAFSIPKGYFEQLTNDIESQTTQRLTIENISKSNSFIIPEEYWNELPKAILDRSLKRKNAVTWFPFENYTFSPQAVSALAASVLLILGITYYVISPTERDYTAYISKSEIVGYFSETSLESNELVLEAMLISNNDLSNEEIWQKTNLNKEDLEIEVVDSDVIEEVYLD